MTKRALDLVLGAVLAVFFTPLIVAMAIGSAIALRAWPFFSQTRIGKGGRDFQIVKIRTMPVTAPAYADKYEIAAQTHIPAYCQLLRTLHLDELPQLWLVVFGRMSLVGPRPEMRMLHETFEPGFADRRVSVRPGCSGLWQIGHGAAGLISETPEYDEVYVANASARLDVWILWRTACMILGRGNTKGITAIPAWALRTQPGAMAQVITLRSHDVETDTRLALDA